MFSILMVALEVPAGVHATTLGEVALNSGLVAGADSLTLGAEAGVLSFLGAAVGLADIVFGVGMLKLSGWAWVSAHVVIAGSIVLSAVNLLASPRSLVGRVLVIAIAAGVVFYPHRPAVLGAFGRSRSHALAEFEAPKPPDAAA
ncbi:MAG: hypothetical protein P4L93_10690 [Coriobacteriia bacterium]|nr:hypothetical protein [Coriobacteriia bacterium]